jgi:serine/threonine protein kinase
VLFCPRSGDWKITDFGLTSEGISQRAYSTRHARGTEGYRAPELVRDGSSVFSKESDIFSLGCIFYELVASKKLFRSDYSVNSYSSTREPPELPHLNAEKRLAKFTELVICAMLEVDWWKRPSARDILEELKHLRNEFTGIRVPQPGGHCPDFLFLAPHSYDWRHVLWLPFWYVVLWIYVAHRTLVQAVDRLLHLRTAMRSKKRN